MSKYPKISYRFELFMLLAKILMIPTSGAICERGSSRQKIYKLT
jgi:hypothetical protein